MDGCSLLQCRAVWNCRRILVVEQGGVAVERDVSVVEEQGGVAVVALGAIPAGTIPAGNSNAANSNCC